MFNQTSNSTERSLASYQTSMVKHFAKKKIAIFLFWGFFSEKFGAPRHNIWVPNMSNLR